jgi:trk system potassium uptake protein TrkA
MRAVFLGGGALSVMTARVLLNRAHEVIIIEQDKDRIDVLSDEFACGFIHSDGSNPAILRETDPRDVDFLFCLTSNDQINIIASLVGRSLGFKRVITKIEAPEFEHICVEGLKDTIAPGQTHRPLSGRYDRGAGFAGIERNDQG